MIFAVSVLGLTLIPGRTPAGRPYQMSFFDAFYFMSYTATTIGFGELPVPVHRRQRMWVTLSIYLTVIGWAYAIGSLLTLLQDAGSARRLPCSASPARCAGCGSRSCCSPATATGELLGALLRRARPAVRGASTETTARIDALDLDAYHADIPGLVGDARDPAISRWPASATRTARGCSR